MERNENKKTNSNNPMLRKSGKDEMQLSVDDVGRLFRKIDELYGDEETRKEKTPNLEELLAESSRLKNCEESDEDEESSPSYSPRMGLSSEQQPSQRYAYVYLFENETQDAFSSNEPVVQAMIPENIESDVNQVETVKLRKSARLANESVKRKSVMVDDPDDVPSLAYSSWKEIEQFHNGQEYSYSYLFDEPYASNVSQSDKLKRKSVVTDEREGETAKRNSVVVAPVADLTFQNRDASATILTGSTAEGISALAVSESPKVVPLTILNLNSCYDDNDEKQNELKWMERDAGNTSANTTFEEQCRKAHLPPPLTDAALKTKAWSFVTTFDRRQLVKGMDFLRDEDLALLKRRHPGFGFCHPGPVSDTVTGVDEWYYADSVVQEVKLLHQTTPFYVVRWVGFEDIYNTVEPEAYLANTAVLLLYKKRDYATASRTNGPTLLRRSNRLNMLQLHHAPTLPHSMNFKSLAFGSAIKLLDELLEIEINADRYDPHIGFHDSSGSVVAALQNQFNFIKNIFCPLITSISGHDLVVSNTCLGSMFGQNQSRVFKKLNISSTTNAQTIKCKIVSGLKRTHQIENGDRYVSFFVFNKYNLHDTMETRHMDMHSTVLMVRATDKFKDAIWHDPSPRFVKKWTPKFLLQAKKPLMRSRSITVGSPSQREDCMYQCFRYIIGIKTGEISFIPDLNSENFRQAY